MHYRGRHIAADNATPMNADLRFPATYSRLLARELKLDEPGRAALLAGTALSPAQLFQLEQTLSAADQYAIIVNALRLSGNPAFGLQFGSHLHVSAHGPLGVAMSTAPTLRESFEATMRFHMLRGAFVQPDAHTEGDRYVLTLMLLVPLDAVGLFLMEAMVASTQWTVEFVLGRPVDEAEIDLGYAAPAHAGRYGDYLHGRVRFGRPATALSLPLALVDQPNPFRDDEAFRQALLQCERLEADRRARDSWSERITALLQQHPGQLWTLPEVAAALHVSARTLMRHLGAEGSCYQALLDEELKRQALLHLESPRHTVAAVAATLGYQDVAAFRRAFKRWTGSTPQDWRSHRLSIRG